VKSRAEICVAHDEINRFLEEHLGDRNSDVVRMLKHLRATLRWVLDDGSLSAEGVDDIVAKCRNERTARIIQ